MARPAARIGVRPTHGHCSPTKKKPNKRTGSFLKGLIPKVNGLSADFDRHPLAQAHVFPTLALAAHAHLDPCAFPAVHMHALMVTNA